MSIQFQEIGFFTTPFKQVTGMPIQPSGARGIAGTITIRPEFAEGLKDLEGFSHIFALYYLHQIEGYDLTVKPFLDNDRHGIFATRSPKRPNPIGLSVMKLEGVENNVVYVSNVDVLDNTPVIDIKPYVPDFDIWQTEGIGWFAGKSGNADHFRSDDRFI